jgi:Uma2 family endonuclease
MVQTKPTPTTTLTEFLRSPNLEESPAWELFAEIVSQKPTPTLHHSILQKRLVGAIDLAGGEYEAFPELRCVLNANSIVPDITILRRDRVPTGNQPVMGAPDWLVGDGLSAGATTGFVPGCRSIACVWGDRPVAYR